MYLAQTKLEINTEKVFTSNENEFFKTTCGTCVVNKHEFELIGRDCNVYGLSINHSLRRSLKIKK